MTQGPFAARTDSDRLRFGRQGGRGFVERSVPVPVGDWNALWSYLQAAGGGDDELTLPYAQSWAIYACVSVRARAFLQARLQLWRGMGDDAPEVTGGRFLETLRRPHPALSQRALWMLTSLYLDLEGETLWLLSRRQGDRMVPIEAGATPEEILVIAGSSASPQIANGTNLVESWIYNGVTFPAHAVWQLRSPNPYSPLRGFGPAEAAMRLAAKEFAAERYDEALTNNLGIPSMVFGSESSLTQPQAEQAKANLSDKLNPANAGKPVVLGNGLKPLNVAFSPTDMGHAELRAWGLDGIMAVFGVTRPLLGMTEGVNFASAEIARKVFWEDTMIPQLEFVAGELEDGLLYRTRETKGYSAGWDFSRVPALRTDLTAKVALVEKLVGLGVKFNKAAELAEWEIDPLADSDFDEPEPLPVAQPAAQQPVAPADRSLAPTERGLERADERRAYHARFEAGLAGADERVAKRTSRVLRDYVLAARKRLREIAANERPVNLAAAQPPWIIKAPPPDLEPALLLLLQLQLPEVAPFVAEFTSSVLPLVEQVYLTAAADLAQELALASPAVGPGTAELAAFMATKRVKLAEGVLSTLADSVVETIARVLLSGGPIDPAQLGLAIQTTLEDLESELRIMLDRIPERAQRIARTEVTAASNSARFAEMRAAGVEQGIWVAANDAATRDSHASIDGQIRATGIEFLPNLRFPGDPAAEAKEVVNCRCALAPYIPADQ